MLIALDLKKFIYYMFNVIGLGTTPLFRNIEEGTREERGNYGIRVATEDDRKFRVKTFFSAVYVGITSTQLAFAIKKGITVQDLVRSMLYTEVLGSNFITVFGHYKRRFQMVDLYNGLLKFERKRNPDNWTPQDKSYKRMTLLQKFYLIFIGVGAEFGIATMTSAFQAYSPCFSGNIGHFLMTPCVDPQQPWTTRDYLTRFLVSAINGYVTVHLLPCVSLESSMWSPMHCFCFNGYLHLLRRDVEKKPSYETIRLFKEIQLLVTHYNAIHGGILSIGLMYISLHVLIFALYVVIGFNDVFSLPELLLYSYLAMGCAINIVLCDGAIKSSIFVTSTEVLEATKKSVLFMANPLQRRFMRAMPILKIILGRAAYFDRNTPLVLLDFSFSQVVNLLLI